MNNINWVGGTPTQNVAHNWKVFINGFGEGSLLSLSSVFIFASLYIARWGMVLFNARFCLIRWWNDFGGASGKEKRQSFLLFQPYRKNNNFPCRRNMKKRPLPLWLNIPSPFQHQVLVVAFLCDMGPCSWPTHPHNVSSSPVLQEVMMPHVLFFQPAPLSPLGLISSTQATWFYWLRNHTGPLFCLSLAFFLHLIS